MDEKLLKILSIKLKLTEEEVLASVEASGLSFDKYYENVMSEDKQVNFELLNAIVYTSGVTEQDIYEDFQNSDFENFDDYALNRSPYNTPEKIEAAKRGEFIEYSTIHDEVLAEEVERLDFDKLPKEDKDAFSKFVQYLIMRNTIKTLKDFYGYDVTFEPNERKFYEAAEKITIPGVTPDDFKSLGELFDSKPASSDTMGVKSIADLLGKEDRDLVIEAIKNGMVDEEGKEIRLKGIKYGKQGDFAVQGFTLSVYKKMTEELSRKLNELRAGGETTVSIVELVNELISSREMISLLNAELDKYKGSEEIKKGIIAELEAGNYPSFAKFRTGSKLFERFGLPKILAEVDVAKGVYSEKTITTTDGDKKAKEVYTQALIDEVAQNLKVDIQSENEKRSHHVLRNVGIGLAGVAVGAGIASAIIIPTMNANSKVQKVEGTYTEDQLNEAVANATADEINALYNKYFPEGKAETIDEKREALMSMTLESHLESELEKVSAYDTIHNEIVSKYETLNGEGSSVGKSDVDMLLELASQGQQIVEDVENINELYAKYYPEGTATSIEDKMEELRNIQVQDLSKIYTKAEYDEAVANATAAEINALYEQYFPEGTAETVDEKREALKEINVQDNDKVYTKAQYDAAIANATEAEINALYEQYFPEGTAETVEDKRAALMSMTLEDGYTAETQNAAIANATAAEINALYEQYFPEGTAETVDEKREALKEINVQDNDKVYTKAQYDAAIANATEAEINALYNKYFPEGTATTVEDKRAALMSMTLEDGYTAETQNAAIANATAAEINALYNKYFPEGTATTVDEKREALMSMTLEDGYTAETQNNAVTEAQLAEAKGIYELFYGEGSAEGMTVEQIHQELSKISLSDIENLVVENAQNKQTLSSLCEFLTGKSADGMSSEDMIKMICEIYQFDYEEIITEAGVNIKE